MQEQGPWGCTAEAYLVHKVLIVTLPQVLLQLRVVLEQGVNAERRVVLLDPPNLPGTEVFSPSTV